MFTEQMRTATITRETTFDTAHLLSNYKGKCNNLHGHTYKIQVSFSSREGLQKEGNNQDMVLDFNEVKDLLKEVVDENFDHAIVFSAKEKREPFEEELYKLVKKHNKKYFEMPSGAKSTAEQMATVIKGLMVFRTADLNLNLKVSSVKLWETPNSFVEV